MRDWLTVLAVAACYICLWPLARAADRWLATRRDRKQVQIQARLQWRSTARPQQESSLGLLGTTFRQYFDEHHERLYSPELDDLGFRLETLRNHWDAYRRARDSERQALVVAECHALVNQYLREQGYDEAVDFALDIFWNIPLELLPEEYFRLKEAAESGLNSQPS
jgi:hypothetical protein